jgi:hypothetical protein
MDRSATVHQEIFCESSFLMRFPRNDARDHWRSFSWNTNFASTEAVTLESVNEAGTYGLQHSEQRPMLVNTCALPLVRRLRLPLLKSLAQLGRLPRSQPTEPAPTPVEVAART